MKLENIRNISNNGRWTYLLQEDMFSEYDKIGIKSIFYKVYHHIKEPVPHSAFFNGMTQCYIMGRRCSLKTLIRKFSLIRIFTDLSNYQ